MSPLYLLHGLQQVIKEGFAFTEFQDYLLAEDSSAGGRFLSVYGVGEVAVKENLFQDILAHCAPHLP